MIVKFNQIRRQPNPEYEFYYKGDTIATAKGIAASHGRPSLLYNRYEYSIPLESYKGKDEAGNFVPHIYTVLKSDKQVGIIYQGMIPQKKILFLSFGYDYFFLKLFGESYYGYEIGFGEDQHYLCIEQNHKTIGIVHKKDRVVNYLDSYTIYLENQEDLVACMLFALYFENARYADLAEVTDNQTEDTSCITVQKELNAHFDPTFIPRIKEMEEITQS